MPSNVRYFTTICLLFAFVGCGGRGSQTVPIPDEATMGDGREIVTEDASRHTTPITEEATAGENDFWNSTYDRILRQHGDDLQLNQIPKPQQAVLAVVNSHGLIGNGGFQYLFEGDLPGDPGFVITREAYKTIGATDAIAAFDKAFAVFPNSMPPADIDERLRLWQSKYNLSDSLTDDTSPDSLYLSAMDGVLIKLNDYIRGNPDAFADLPN